jgi:hypothetical protein
MCALTAGKQAIAFDFALLTGIASEARSSLGFHFCLSGALLAEQSQVGGLVLKRGCSRWLRQIDDGLAPQIRSGDVRTLFLLDKL